MPQLLAVILYKTSLLPELLETWQDIGVPGVTIMKGAGGHRTRSRLGQLGLRTISDLLNLDEIQSKILLAIIDDDDLLERAIAEAERIIGDFYQPDTGLLFTIPINRVVGILSREKIEEAAKSASASPPLQAMTDIELLARDTPVSTINEILNLEPVIVQTHQPLLETAETLINNPNVDIACVVNEQKRLVGLLPLQSLVEDLFMMIVPEEFLSETHDREAALHFAKLSGTQTVEDAMIPALWVKPEDTLKEAFRKMHENKLSGIPIVNDRYEIAGYINLLELLAIYARGQKTSEN